MDAIPIETQHFLHQSQTLIIVLAVFNAIMLYDFVICIPAEIKHIFYPDFISICKGTRRILATIADLLLLLPRLFVVPMAALSFILSIGQPSHCSAMNRTLLIMYAISTSASCATFALRTIAIRGLEYRLQTCLWTVWLCITTIWIYWSTQITITQVVASNSYQSTCSYDGGSIPNWTWILFLCITIFDVAIFGIIVNSLYRFTCIREQYGNLGSLMYWKYVLSGMVKLFYDDTVKYFLLSNIIIITLTVWNYYHREYQYYTALVAPIHVWLNLSIAPRAIRSMKLYRVYNKDCCFDMDGNPHVEDQSKNNSKKRKRNHQGQKDLHNSFSAQRFDRPNLQQVDDNTSSTRDSITSTSGYCLTLRCVSNENGPEISPA